MLRILLIVLGFSFSAYSLAKVSPELDQRIRVLIGMTTYQAAQLKSFHRNFRNILQKNEKLSKDQKARIIQSVGEKLSRKSLEDVFVPIYAKHYTLSDINSLITFYRSPTGKKLLATDSTLKRELQEAGINYGQKIMADISVQVQVEGMVPKK